MNEPDLTLDQAKKAMAEWVTNHHPDRAAINDPLYDEIVDKLADRLNGDLTVKLVKRDVVRQMLDSNLRGKANAANSYLRKIAKGEAQMMFPELGSLNLILKVPVYKEGKDKPDFERVRLGAVRGADLDAWARYEDDAAEDQRQARQQSVAGAKVLKKWMDDYGGTTWEDVIEKNAGEAS